MTVSPIKVGLSLLGLDRGLGLARGGISSSLPFARQLSPLFLCIGKRIAHRRARSVMGKATFHVAHYSADLPAGHGANIRSFAP